MALVVSLRLDSLEAGPAGLSDLLRVWSQKKGEREAGRGVGKELSRMCSLLIWLQPDTPVISDIQITCLPWGKRLTLFSWVCQSLAMDCAAKGSYPEEGPLSPWLPSTRLVKGVCSRPPLSHWLYGHFTLKEDSRENNALLQRNVSLPLQVLWQGIIGNILASEGGRWGRLETLSYAYKLLSDNTTLSPDNIYSLTKWFLCTLFIGSSQPPHGAEGRFYNPRLTVRVSSSITELGCD